MMGALYAFEVKYQIKRPLFILTAGLFFLFCFGAMTTDAVMIGGGVAGVHRNAPFVIVNLLAATSVFGMFVVAAFVVNSALRDFEYDTHALFFTKPIGKLQLLVGRFLGSLTVSSLVMVAAALGLLIGSVMPWLEPERLGPPELGSSLYGLLVFALPNLVLVGGVFFAIAILTRSQLYTYLGLMLLFLLYLASGALLSDLDNRTLASLLDPFGSESFSLATRYWTAFERNTTLPTLGAGGGLVLANRLIWLGVGIGLLVVACIKFKPTYAGAARRRRGRAGDAAAEPDAAEALVPAPAAALPAVTRRFSAADSLRQVAHQARIEVAGVVRSVSFPVLLLLGIAIVTLFILVSDRTFGTSVYPVTRLMLQDVGLGFGLPLIIMLVFYSGELVWKERARKLDEVYDALPIPDWIPLVAKLAALAVVILATLGVGILTTVVYQLARGYHRLEPGLYLEGALLAALPFLLSAVLALFVQVLTNSKFAGYLVMVAYLILRAVVVSLGYSHHLYRYGQAPELQYSDMNGYGHFLRAYLWFDLYWALFALLLFLLAQAIRVRGSESSLAARRRQFRARFRGPLRLAAGLAFLGFVATGSFIFYNTNVLNRYESRDAGQARRAAYEKKYRRYKDLQMPRITAVEAAVDIFPEERRLDVRGRYQMKNETAQPIPEVHVSLNPDAHVRRFAFGGRAGTRVRERDKLSGYTIYTLARPLAPGEAMQLDFDLAYDYPGFVDGGPETQVVGNGTFFQNAVYFPSFGYQAGEQLDDRNDRRKYHLPVVPRMAAVNDPIARRNTYIRHDSDWIDFDTTVSTSAGQIAVAPGYLQREWTAGGRRYFHYRMDSPMLNFFCYLSADYRVRRDSWRGVAIEIYYQPEHEYNVARMIDAIKKSLDYYTVHFGPYQHRQVRILEVPEYHKFAQSFPNTIAYSEAVGFIADFRDPEAIDYVFYVTAHELAHQWWAHQVIGADVQGSTMLAETMAQYSALMVMEKEYGKEKMRRFLKYELDQYLVGRAVERDVERPLMLVENQQYIHYNKGSLAMYALKDAIGEEALDRALALYVKAVRFQQPPYTNTPELLRYFEDATPPALRSMLDDLFRTITLFDNRVKSVASHKLPDGRYAVDLTVEARKMRAGEQGKETAVPIDDWIDIGVFGAPKDKQARGESNEAVLYLQKQHIRKSPMTFHLVVPAAPVRAGIDPYNKLVDRDSKDNVKKVTPGAG